MILTDSMPLDMGNLVNGQHPLAHGLQDWWLVLPGFLGGTRWQNLMARARPATLSNLSNTRSLTSGWGPTRRQGGFGELRLDGTNDRITVADHARYSFAVAGQDQPFSLCCSVWMNSISTTSGIFAKWQVLDSIQEWITYKASSALIFELYHATTSTVNLGRSVTMTTALYQSQWLRLVFTYNGNETNAGMAIYRNGVRVDTTNTGAGTYTGMSDTTGEVSFGSYQGAANFLAGKLDDYRIYNRVLSPQEVLEEYRNTLTGYDGLLNRLPVAVRVPAGASPGTKAPPPWRQPWRIIRRVA